MPKSLNITAITPKPDVGIIRQLEHALAEAIAGNLLEINLIGRHVDGICFYYAGHRARPYEMYGALMDRAEQYREETLVEKV